MQRHALGILLLAAAMVAVIAWLQKSLVLVNLLSSEVHWAVVLLVVPVANGVLSALTTRRPYLVCATSSFIASVALYYLYSRHFWRVPPTPVQAAAFFTTLTLFGGFGVTLARGVRGRPARSTGRTMRQAALLAYHALAIAAAVVTIIGFLRAR